MTDKLLMVFGTIYKEKIVHDINEPFPYRDNLPLALSLLNSIHRFNGSIHYSVLSHTLLGAFIIKELYDVNTDLKAKTILKEWLFHDMHEIILNDIPSPVKKLMRSMVSDENNAIDLLEAKLEKDVQEAFNLENKYHSNVKEIDNLCYEIEASFFDKQIHETTIVPEALAKFKKELNRVNMLAPSDKEAEFMYTLALLGC